MLEGCGSDCSVRSPLDLGDGCWFLPSNPMPEDDFFQTWYGATAAGVLRGAQFCLAVVGDLNSDARQLRRRALLLYDGVVIEAMPRLGEGWLLTLDGRLHANSWSQPSQRRAVFRHSASGVVDDSTLRAAKAVCDGLEAVTSDSRLSRGAYILERALIEGRYLQERLHEFVRALEALVKPERGRTRRQFVDRCQTFAKRGRSAAATLGEIYDIRCKVEHVHDGLTAVEGVTERLKLRAAQVEFLALSAYARVLTNAALRSHLETDAAIDAFWRLEDDRRRAIWGGAVDLDTDAKPTTSYQFAD